MQVKCNGEIQQKILDSKVHKTVSAFSLLMPFFFLFVLFAFMGYSAIKLVGR